MAPLSLLKRTAGLFAQTPFRQLPGPDRTTDELRNLADSVGWWHSIDFGSGVTTRGHKSVERLQSEWQAMRLPDLRGKTVLDVGAFDGYFSFCAEESGAKEVVALDY